MNIQEARKQLELDNPTKIESWWLDVITWIEIHWQIFVNKFSK